MNAEILANIPGFSGLPLSPESMEILDSSIRRIVPAHLMLQAEQIVLAHRPEGSNPAEDPLMMAGLIPTHHGDLNRPSVVYPGGRKLERKELLNFVQSTQATM